MDKKTFLSGLIALFVIVFAFSFGFVTTELAWAGPGCSDSSGNEPNCEGNCTIHSCDGGYKCCGTAFGADCLMDLDCIQCCRPY